MGVGDVPSSWRSEEGVMDLVEHRSDKRGHEATVCSPVILSALPASAIIGHHGAKMAGVVLARSRHGGRFNVVSRCALSVCCVRPEWRRD